VHTLSLSADQYLPSDPWRPSLSDLDAIAHQLLGPSTAGWLRPAGHSVVIGNRKRGCVAACLQPEFSELFQQVETLLVDQSPASRLRAAAFFHLRFENIHPLRDGNGRVGRLLLCAQCSAAYRVPIDQLLRSLEDYRFKYRDAFRAPRPEFQFELLLDVLGLLVGLPIPPAASGLPYALDPRFLDPTPIPPRSPSAVAPSL
jgi:hypothetical protein